MKSQIVIAALLSALSVPAFAGHAAAQAAKEMVPLADGGTLYIFKDGKMAQESRFGRAVYLNVGASVCRRRMGATSRSPAMKSLASGRCYKKSTADDAADVRCLSKLLHSVTETRAPIGRARAWDASRATTSAQGASFCDVKRINFPEMDPASPSTVIRPRDIWRE